MCVLLFANEQVEKDESQFENRSLTASSMNVIRLTDANGSETAPNRRLASGSVSLNRLASAPH